MLSWQEAMKHLQQEPVAPVYTLVGNEWLLIRQFVRQVASRFVISDGGAALRGSEDFESAIVEFDYEQGGSVQAMLACQTVSLFSQQEIVRFSNLGLLAPSTKSKGDVDWLIPYLAKPAPGKVLIVEVPAEKLDERKKIVKLLHQYPVVACHVDEGEALRVVAEIAHAQNIEIAERPLKELCRRVASVSQASLELKKLDSYTGHQAVDLNAVRELVAEPLEDNVFHWIDGVVRGNLGSVFHSLRGVRLAGYDELALFAMLARQLRLMWHAKRSQHTGVKLQEVAAQVGAHPYALKIAAEQSKGLSELALASLIKTSADLEFAVKTGREDAGMALERMILSIAVSAKSA
ncbi:DNA polymerase III subunit delta [Alicyclobacillaceae bacterium I2511]|nr:DNA polymerase III subunit delta [Alicyclobacillaceae bacterium I2511]